MSERFYIRVHEGYGIPWGRLGLEMMVIDRDYSHQVAWSSWQVRGRRLSRRRALEMASTRCRRLNRWHEQATL